MSIPRFSIFVFIATLGSAGGAGMTLAGCNEDDAVVECGDGLIRGDEECDDGGVDNEDGCDSACMIEQCFECSGEPSVCFVPIFPRC